MSRTTRLGNGISLRAWAIVRVFILAVTLTSARRAQAQSCGLSAPSADPSLPSPVATAALLVQNDKDVPTIATVQPTLPNGWRMVVGREPISIAKHGFATWVGGFVVPPGTAAGVYYFVVDVEQRADGNPNTLRLDDVARAKQTVVCVAVAERRTTTLRVDFPRVLVAGVEIPVRVQLRNIGNVPTKIRIKPRGTVVFSSSAPELAVHFRASHVLELAALDSLTTTVHLKVDANSPRSGKLLLDVQIVDENSRQVLTEARGQLLVVPTPTTELRQSRQLSFFTATRVGAGSAIAPFDLYGGGLLDSTRTVELMVRGPTTAYARFGDRSEYRFAYREPTKEFTIGDQSIGLSPMSMRVQPLFGAEAEQTFGDVRVKGFLARDRWWSGSGSTAALQSTWRKRARSLSVHALTRSGSLRDDGEVGGFVAMDSSRFHRFDFELNGSHQRGGASATATARDSVSKEPSQGVAVRTHAVLHYGESQLEGDLLHATTSFPGAVRGTGALALGARYGWRSVVFVVSHREDRTNGGFVFIPSLGLGVLQLPSETRHANALSIESRKFGSLTYQATDRIGYSGAFHYSGAESILRSNTSWRLRATSLSLEASYGTRTDRLSATHGTFARVSTVVGQAFGTWLNLSLHGERERGTMLWSSNGARLAWGAVVSAELPFGVHLSVDGLTNEQTSLLDGAIPLPRVVHTRQLLWTARKVAGTATFTFRHRVDDLEPLLQGLPSYHAQVTYLEIRMPFGVASPIKRGAPDVRVRVVDAMSSAPLAGALVRRGDAVAITGPGGEARLPGETSDKTPIELVAPPAGRPELTIIANKYAFSPVAGAQLLRLISSGQVRGIAIGTDAQSRGGARIAVMKGRDTLVTRTDAKGAFHIAPMTPGRWTVEATSTTRDGDALYARDTLTMFDGLVASVSLRMRAKERVLLPLAVSEASARVARDTAISVVRPVTSPSPSPIGPTAAGQIPSVGATILPLIPSNRMTRRRRPPRVRESFSSPRV